MTSQQPLDRLKRVAKLSPVAGIRVRRNMRYMDEQIGIMIDVQIANEARFAALAESQKHADKNLDAILISYDVRRKP